MSSFKISITLFCISSNGLRHKIETRYTTWINAIIEMITILSRLLNTISNTMRRTFLVRSKIMYNLAEFESFSPALNSLNLLCLVSSSLTPMNRCKNAKIQNAKHQHNNTPAIEIETIFLWVEKSNIFISDIHPSNMN
jgi:hypothetical protein